MNKLTKTFVSVRHNKSFGLLVAKRTFLYSSKKTLDRNSITWLQQRIDFSPKTIQNWFDKRRRELLLKNHKFNAEKVQSLGYELSAAQFVVKINGAVKFEGIDGYYSRQDFKDSSFISLPCSMEKVKVEAIDVSNTKMMYLSFDNFDNLKHLKYINLSNCSLIDDWCLDRLVQFRNSLKVLDLSYCPNITENGLACLHKLNNLTRLVIRGLPEVSQPKLMTILLEEVLPNCYIDGETDLITNNEDDNQENILSKNKTSLFEGQKEINDINRINSKSIKSTINNGDINKINDKLFESVNTDNYQPNFLKNWQDLALKHDIERKVASKADGVDELYKKFGQEKHLEN